MIYVGIVNYLAVEMGGGHSGDEELGAVGVGASVGHGEETRLGVLLDEVLVVESAAVDRFTTTAICKCQINVR
jgi:hypothetical protein